MSRFRIVRWAEHFANAKHASIPRIRIPLSQATLDSGRPVVHCRTHIAFRKCDDHSWLHKLHRSVTESELQTQPYIKMGIVRSKPCFSSNNRPIFPNHPYILQSPWLLFHPQPQRGTRKHTNPYLPPVPSFLPKARPW